MKRNGKERFCKKCENRKPDRSHHCSLCNKCVLKMDHHCIWVNNCNPESKIELYLGVGYNNYKYFCLFLFYSTVYCVFGFISFIPIVTTISIKEPVESMRMFHILFLTILSVLFGIVLFTFSIIHFMLLIKNRTTIESMERPPHFRKEELEYSSESELYQDLTSTNANDLDLYNLGWRENLLQVFGNRPRYWFIPIQTRYAIYFTIN